LGRPMDATEALAGLLLDSAPNNYCYLCLAAKLRLSEKAVRDAAQPRVLLKGFHVRRLRCAHCGREDDLLQPPDPIRGER
jgi:hypothetical protein